MTHHIIGPDDPALAAMQEAIAGRPELDIALTIVPWADYRDRLMAALSAEAAPVGAVFVPGHVWIPELADKGYLAAIDMLASKVDQGVWNAYDPDDILPGVQTESRFAGHQYMLPYFSDGHILFYRADLVDLPDAGAGVLLVAPGEMLEWAARAKAPAGGHVLALKAHPSEIFLDWLPYLWDAGGILLDEAGRPAIDSEAGVRALEMYCTLRAFCPADTHDFGNAEIANLLRGGKVSMAVTWGGQAAPIFLGGDSAYRAAVFPTPWNATWGVAIPANQPEGDQVEILEALLGLAGPEGDRAITRAAGSPVRGSSYAPDELARYFWLDAQREMLARARTLPAAPETGAYLGALYEAVYAAFVGEVAPGDALAKAARTMREALG